MDLQAALLIRDLRRFLAVLPAWVGRRVCILLVLMLVLAGVEVLAIFSMSLMAMSIAAPQTVLSHPILSVFALRQVSRPGPNAVQARGDSIPRLSPCSAHERQEQPDKTQVAGSSRLIGKERIYTMYGFSL